MDIYIQPLLYGTAYMTSPHSMNPCCTHSVKVPVKDMDVDKNEAV